MTMEMVKEMAEREGVDLDAIDTEAFKKENRLKNDISESHECCREAYHYSKMVQAWFDSAIRFLEDSEAEETSVPTSALPENNPLPEQPDYADAMQVIQWYQHFIHVKLRRAVRGKLDEASEEWDEYQKDSDGSAKIALVAIDRSIAAWGEIRNHFLARQDDVLGFITCLDGLRRKVEAEFPHARSFIRPGFDKIDLND